MLTYLQNECLTSPVYKYLNLKRNAAPFLPPRKRRSSKNLSRNPGPISTVQTPGYHPIPPATSATHTERINLTPSRPMMRYQMLLSLSIKMVIRPSVRCASLASSRKVIPSRCSRMFFRFARMKPRQSSCRVARLAHRRWQIRFNSFCSFSSMS